MYPVSYTHLDVYKRQGVTTVLHSKERRNQLSHFVDSKASNPIVTIEFETLERILSDLVVEDSFDWVFVDTDIAAIMNTSATTGQFKSVPLRWGQIKAHVQASQEVLDVYKRQSRRFCKNCS